MSTAVVSGSSVIERNSLLVDVVLTFITLGFYVPIWFLLRRRWLNRLESPIKMGMALPLVMLTLRSAAFLLDGVTALDRQQGLPPSLPLDLTRTVVSLVFFVLLFKLAFLVREILSDHLKLVLSRLSGHPSQYQVDMSGILTFLFSIWYLQYKINECFSLSQHWTAATDDAPSS